MLTSIAFAALACLPTPPQEIAFIDMTGTVTSVAPGLTGHFASSAPGDTVWGELSVDLALPPQQLPNGVLGYVARTPRTQILVGDRRLSSLSSGLAPSIQITDGLGGSAGGPDRLTYEATFTYSDGSMGQTGTCFLEFTDADGDAWTSATLESLPTPLLPDPAAGQIATLTVTDSSGAVMIEARIDAFGFDTSFESHCFPIPNSTGRPGRITGMGSRAFADNSFSIFADRLPMGSWGLFITSPNEGFVANPGGNFGNLCLGAPIGRFIGPGEVMNSGTSGTMTFPVDLMNLPTVMSFESAAPGETRYFQLWHRDVSTGSLSSNFTNTLAITLE